MAHTLPSTNLPSTRTSDVGRDRGGQGRLEARIGRDRLGDRVRQRVPRRRRRIGQLLEVGLVADWGLGVVLAVGCMAQVG